MVNWSDLDVFKHQNEAIAGRGLMESIRLSSADRTAIDHQAVELVKIAREITHHKGLMETFLEEFGLSNNEGLALMCLAESLLRVPDARTADKLIAEKISSGEWGSHKGQSDSWLVNASTWGLMLTGKVVHFTPDIRKDISGFMRGLTRKAGKPVIRAAMMQAMRIMGEQFVVGRTIDSAIRRSEKLGLQSKTGLCSFDMLGEGARTLQDAKRYHAAYLDAIKALGSSRGGPKKETCDPEDINGISVKLSALHPRYDALHEDIVMAELYPGLLVLAQAAAEADINFCLDAEEADRLVLSLKLLERLTKEPSLGKWSGLGLAVQAYQKRSLAQIDMLTELAKSSKRRLMVRLVKGAYWDTEIKHSQVEGHADFPVWTRKSTTDICYLACARKLLDAGRHIYPQFATHNAHSVAAIQHMATDTAEFEFQRLHGMGEALYRAAKPDRRVRIYAPVGAHEDLLPYLVRRLLENGANTSFVHRFLDEDVPPEDVAKSPFTDEAPVKHPQIPLPVDMFGEARRNSQGFDLYQDSLRKKAEQNVLNYSPMDARPIVDGAMPKGKGEALFSPTDASVIGSLITASEDDVAGAFTSARKAFPAWNAQGGAKRAEILTAMGDILEAHMEEFVTLMAKEAGKTFPDSIAEVREAVDFCRYYAVQAKKEFGVAVRLPGPSGETNSLTLSGRGTFVCISPWNFPLAIFAGQVAAALAAGNTVIAKPAEQTPLTAFRAVQLFQKAGLPKDVLHLLIGAGETVGAALVEHPHVAGVCFTGSTVVAKIINRSLAAKDGAIPVLIAETGGFNGMFVDTTALKEQVIDDVVSSAFNAAGQRCSALRILFLPDGTADSILEGLSHAMDSLVIGDPALAGTDVGPVIDKDALQELSAYTDNLPKSMTLLKQCEVPRTLDVGHFMPPTLIELNSLDDFNTEKFGPILHVVRYGRGELNALMAAFAAKDYGLTLGIHSRLNEFASRVMRTVPAGNIYINRNIIGAVVGVQPFGGCGLSGTGPKAGGPHYLHRFATEVTITNNISAQGGDPALLSLEA
ncbi:MAG: bifunctional proline dehydrogenase/L-glutamate gamma-semialdehyde dehydrogenase PutA [Alphaproteobacteria bacterium]